MNNNSGNGIKAILIILIIIFVIAIFKSCTEPSASDKWYQEHKETIDAYNEKKIIRTIGKDIMEPDAIHGQRMKNLNMMVTSQMNIEKGTDIRIFIE